jgi:bifunctional non-homologous end joining protein LigD
MAFQRKKPAAIGAKAPFPGFIAPALASSIEKAPNGERWIHEIKFDGYRVQVHLANTEVKVYTRRGYDWTHRFKKIASDAWHIGAGSAIIDGEVVASAADGTTDFSVLQNELKGRSTKIVMVAFDLLYLNGYDCGSCHWSSERRSSRRASTKRTSSLARASRSTAPKCSSMHARPG